MPSLNFPTAPADQQTYSANGITYQYDAAKSRWDIVPPTVEFETSAQLDLRDTANRSRSNHTGTQTASTITDFDTEVSNNTDVAANTSARHDAVTVVDSSEIDFTLTGQQITASIVAGSIDESKLDASVNASLDLADTALQASDIVNKAPLDSPALTGTPTAPTAAEGTNTTQIATTAFVLANAGSGVENGIVINGVANFWQNTAPTTRVDASALVAGDRWWNPTTQREGFWNGTYWLTTQQYVSQFNLDGSVIVHDFSNTGNDLHGMNPITEDFFAESSTLQVLTNGSTFDVSNYWTFYCEIQVLNRETDGGNESILSETKVLNDSYTGTTYIPMTLNYNTAVFMPNANAITMRHYVRATMTGAPSRLRIYGTYFRYRLILG